MKTFLSISAVICLTAGASADEVALTAQYPSPLGIYSALTTTGRTVFGRDGGGLGIGAADPLAPLHLKGVNPLLRLEAPGLGSFDLETRNVAGAKRFVIRDPDAATDRLIIDPLGNVGIGLSTPTRPLTIKGNRPLGLRPRPGDPYVVLAWVLDPSYPHVDAGPHYEMGLTNSDFTLGYYFGTMVAPLSTGLAFSPDGTIRVFRNGSPESSFRMAGGGGGYLAWDGRWFNSDGTWKNPSSRELKTAIAPLNIDAARSALKELEPVTYRYKQAPTERHVGFIAEDVPDLIASTDRKGLSSMDIIAVLTTVVQENQRQLEGLKSRIEDGTR